MSIYLSIYLSSPGDEDQPRGGRRDSLSPDSAAEETGSRKGRRDSNFGANSDKVIPQNSENNRYSFISYIPVIPF